MDLRRTLKQLLLAVFLGLGLGRLAARLTRGQIRVLAYHGISLGDEHRFRPKLFMTPETFARRMHRLAAGGWRVLGLGEALALRTAGRLPARPVVLTVDDGWAGCQTGMFPVLRRLSFPATLYVATCYVGEDTPVWSVFIDYLLWCGRGRRLGCAELGLGAGPQLDLDTPEGRARASDQLWQAWLDCPDEAERRRLLDALAAATGAGEVDALLAGGRFRIMGPPRLAAVAADGIDLQLHTHGHRMPAEAAALAADLAENRTRLAGLAPGPLVHFCYPSGLHRPEQEPALAALGIASATTCQPGFVRADTRVLALPRFLDGEDCSDLEFEFELCGAAELWRRLRARLRG